MAGPGRREEGGDFISYQRAESQQRIKAWESLGSSEETSQLPRAEREMGSRGLNCKLSLPPLVFPTPVKKKKKIQKSSTSDRRDAGEGSRLPTMMPAPLPPSLLAARRLRGTGEDGGNICGCRTAPSITHGCCRRQRRGPPLSAWCRQRLQSLPCLCLHPGCPSSLPRARPSRQPWEVLGGEPCRVTPACPHAPSPFNAFT